MLCRLKGLLFVGLKGYMFGQCDFYPVTFKPVVCLKCWLFFYSQYALHDVLSPTEGCTKANN